MALVLAVVLGVVFTSFAATPGSAQTTRSEEPNSADRMVFWSGCPDLMDMKDAELERWHRRGVDGFACTIGHLFKLGGEHRFTGDLNAMSGRTQLGALSPHLEHRAPHTQARHEDVPRVLFANSLNTRTPLAEWFDDAAWSKTVLPEIKGLAAGAKALGFDGITFDQELYPQSDGRSTASWSWAYDGNTHTEAEVRSQVKARGQQIMETVLSVFPKVEILAYGSFFPDVWDELVQLEVNRDASANRDFVYIDLWDGMTIPDGYESIQFLNAIFYKTPHITDATWDTAYTYEYNRFYAMLSQRLSNWAGAADRVSETPFVWISNGSTDFEVAKDPPYVTDQLAARAIGAWSARSPTTPSTTCARSTSGPTWRGCAPHPRPASSTTSPADPGRPAHGGSGGEGHQPRRGRDGQPGGPGGALEDRRRSNRCRPDGMGPPGRARRGLDLADDGQPTASRCTPASTGSRCPSRTSRACFPIPTVTVLA